MLLKKSTVGAGDSMVEEWSGHFQNKIWIRWGVACGGLSGNNEQKDSYLN
jgi:fructose-1-phosphate kinase PfkB-like protein